MNGPIDADTFARHVAEHRSRHNRSLRAAADEAGVPFNTLSRAEKGHLPDLANFARLVTWMGQDPADYLRAPSTVRSVSTVDQVREVLHADPALDRAAAEQIAGLVAQLYGTLARRPSPIVHVQAASTFTPPAAALLGSLLGRLQDGVSVVDAEPGWAT